jgi:streptogramin lyase
LTTRRRTNFACAVLTALLSSSARAQVVTEFSAGISPGAVPYVITAGPDGNLWFTENGGNRIGRITPPTGFVTEFSAGISPGAGLYGITAGPDGNLWFTESTGNRIGRIMPAGTVTEFSAGISPGAGLQTSRRARMAICGSPNTISAGSDGSRRPER